MHVFLVGEAPGPRGADKSLVPFFGDAAGQHLYAALRDAGAVSLPAVVDSLLVNPSLLERMRDSARLLGKPNAARDIAIALLSSIPPEEAE